MVSNSTGSIVKTQISLLRGINVDGKIHCHEGSCYNLHFQWDATRIKRTFKAGTSCLITRSSGGNKEARAIRRQWQLWMALNRIFWSSASRIPGTDHGLRLLMADYWLPGNVRCMDQNLPSALLSILKMRTNFEEKILFIHFFDFNYKLSIAICIYDWVVI